MNNNIASVLQFFYKSLIKLSVFGKQNLNDTKTLASVQNKNCISPGLNYRFSANEFWIIQTESE